ncbi:MAG: hypothetical protein NMNS02_00890 [Nitrosomonas sp.]|nr:MAG: hypothetical protein NMNS02_00890 [Nitrosomonas sp.]
MDEWSEDGCLLRVTKRVSREKCVWDMVHDEIREVNEDDKWQRLQSEQGNSRKLISPTRYGRYRNFSGKTIAGKSMSGFKDEAACPYDPSLLATVGGDDHEREVRVWRVVETAD